MDNRDNFSQKTIDLLAKRVSYRCSNPYCRRMTVGSNSDSSHFTNIGVAAHITAASKGGPRYDDLITQAERKSQDNGIWLCQTCSVLIDKDEKLYPVPLLRMWKKEAEEMSMLNLLTNDEQMAHNHTHGDTKTKTNIMLFVGNGFDISMKMHTTYNEFFNWYCEQKNKMPEDYKDYIAQKFSSKKRWNTWSDFEKDLLEIVCQQGDVEYREEFKVFYCDILEKLACYIRIHQNQVIAELEQCDDASFVHFTNSIQVWHDELNDQQFSMIRRRHPELCFIRHEKSNQELVYINFNYSKVFDEILKRTNDKENVIHVHGCIDGTDIPVLGVDDVQLIDTCFDEEELYYLLKNNIIDQMQTNWNRLVDHHLWESDIICIYGMSIGKTDSMWWKKILQWLQIEEHDLIIFWKSDTLTELLNIRKLKSNVAKRLLRFGETDDIDQAELLNRIHVVINPQNFLQFDV